MNFKGILHIPNYPAWNLSNKICVCKYLSEVEYCQHLHKLRKISVTAKTYLIKRQSSPIGYKRRISVNFKIQYKVFQNCRFGVNIRRQNLMRLVPTERATMTGQQENFHCTLNMLLKGRMGNL